MVKHKKIAKKTVGRPSKKDNKDDDAVTKLIAAFWRGCNVTEACFYSGISRETYYRWVKDMPEISDIFANARTKVNQKAKEVIINAIQNGDVSAAKWWLEKSSNSEFGPNADKLVDELAETEKIESELQQEIDRSIANKYRVHLFRKREVLLAEYNKKNEYLISRVDRLMKLSDKELTDYAGIEVWATGLDNAGIRRQLLIRLGGENYKDLIPLLDDTSQKYENMK